MRLQDISGDVALTSSNQDEAIQNIKAAPTFGLTPESFAEDRNELLPVYKQKTMPTEASPVVARTIASSSEKAAAVAPDAKQFSTVERVWGSFKKSVGNVTGDPARHRALTWKQMNNSELTQDERDELASLNALAEEDYGQETFGESWAESLPGMFAGAIIDMPMSMVRNPKLAASFIVPNALIGGGVGAATGPVGAAAGALAGAGRGAAMGFLPVTTYDAYQNSTASTYIALSNLRDDQGQSIVVNDDEKKMISHGVGMVSGALALGGGKLMQKFAPIFKNLSSAKFLSQLVSRTGDKTLREGFMTLGKAMLAEGSEEALQEFVQLAGEEIGRLGDADGTQILNGILNAGRAVAANKDGAAGRIGTAFTVGAGVGGAVNVAGRTGQKIVDKRAAKKGITAAPETPKVQVPKAEALPFTDITPDTNATPVRMDAALEVQGVLQFQTFVDLQSKAIQETNLGKKSPEMVAELRKNMGAEHDQTHVWFDLDDMRNLADDPNKGQMIRDMLTTDAVQTVNQQNNAPIMVPIEKMMAVHDVMPEISEYVKMRPELPIPSQVEAYLEARKELAARQEQVLSNLKVDQDRDPLTRAYDVKLNEGMEDVQMAALLRTQEVADGYLARLDSEDIAFRDAGDADGLARNNIIRARVEGLKASLPNDVQAGEVLKAALDREVPDVRTFTEGEYLNQDGLLEAFSAVAPEGEVKKVLEAQLKAKQAVVDNINETAKYEMNKVISEVEAQAIEVQADIEAERIANDPDFAVVDRFLRNDKTWFPNARFREESDMTGNHAKPGFSPFAIDPSTLTDAQRKQFEKNPLMKQHKVFVKGGISADDAAMLLGVNGADNLLNILSKTPNRDDAIETRVAAQKRRLRKEAEEAVDIDKTSLRAAYDAKLANTMTEMDIMWKASRDATKTFATRMMKAPLRTADIKNQAKETIRQTPIGQLNANQFKVGERNSRSKFAAAFKKGELLEASQFKMSEALNSELAIETHSQIGKVNRAKRFFARMETAELQAELKFANGGEFEAWREITDTFRLTGSNRGVEEVGAFAKLVESAHNMGIADLTIPERLADPRQHVSELTVEQVGALYDTGRAILKMAREKNELIKTEGRDPNAQMNLQSRAREMVEQAKTVKGFNLDRAESTQDPSFWTSFLNGADELVTLMVKNGESIALQLDNEVTGGLFNKYLIAPLNGTDGVESSGLLGKAKDNVRIKNTMAAAIEKFGKTEFSKLETNDRYIPEFKDLPRLNRGKLTEGRLLMMLMNMGTDGNSRTMAENFGTSIETIQTVLDRELGERHAVFAQTVMNMFQDLYPRVVDLHQKTKGITPEMVEASSFNLGGKTYPGGYFPRQYSAEMDYQKIRRSSKELIQSLSNGKKADMGPFNYADDMTRQGHTMQRTGSDRPINLDIGSIGMHFEAVVHDLNMRIPISNNIRMLTDGEVAKHITAAVGKEGYLTLLNMSVRAATSTEMQNNALFNSSKMWDQITTLIRRTHSVVSLLFRAPTIFIQPSSLAYATEKMGSTGPSYIGMVSKMIASDPTLMWKDLGRWAESTLPSLALAGGDLNENIRDPISEMMPRRRFKDPVSTAWEKIRKKPAKTVTQAMADISDWSIKGGFSMLGAVDDTQKKVVLAAAYAQFMHGDAEGFSYADVQKMPVKERENQAKIYATSVVRSTLTAGSVLDRSEIQYRAPMMAMYFNDTRNAIANHLRQGRQMKHAWVDGELVDSAKIGTVMLLQMAAVQIFQDLARGNTLPFLDDEKTEDEKLSETLAYLGTSPLKTLSSVPYVKDMAFLAGRIDMTRDNPMFGKSRVEVASPVTQTMTNIVYAGFTMMDFMDAVINDEEFNPDKNKVKSSLYTAGLLTGGRVPVNALFDLYKRSEEFDVNEYTKPFTAMYDETFRKFEKQQATLEPEQRIPEVYVDAARQVRDQLVAGESNESQVADTTGVFAPDRIPNSVYEIIGQIESGGRWYAKNPNSTAAGVYQFLEGTWRDIMDRAPQLKLTTAGRTSANTEQQQKAMEWFTQDNARRLARADIEITTDSLYAAHFLGAAQAIEVLSAPAETKLKKLVSNDVMQANVFPGSMTVRGFKAWIGKKVKSGERQLAKNQGANVDNEVDN